MLCFAVPSSAEHATIRVQGALVRRGAESGELRWAKGLRWANNPCHRREPPKTAWIRGKKSRPTSTAMSPPSSAGRSGRGCRYTGTCTTGWARSTLPGRSWTRGRGAGILDQRRITGTTPPRQIPLYRCRNRRYRPPEPEANLSCRWQRRQPCWRSAQASGCKGRSTSGETPSRMRDFRRSRISVGWSRPLPYHATVIW